MSAKTTPLARHVYAVQRYVAVTNPRYASLYRPRLATHPICFFGNPEKAIVATVGLNPSSTEFLPGRNWPSEIDHKALTERCRTYFSRDPTAAHKWFGKWEEALSQIGAAYEDGSAVHLDVSPRATRSLGSLRAGADHALVIQMLRADLWTFFGTLELCSNLKLILLAGTATKDYYVNEFLKEFAPDCGWQLEGEFKRGGEAAVSRHNLLGKFEIPVFFCSHSPAAEGCRLPERMRENSGPLREILTA